MTNNIQQLRSNIAQLEAKEKEGRAASKLLREARNRLAYLTGVMFVAVVCHTEIVVYGALADFATRGSGLSIRFDGMASVRVSYCYSSGSTLTLVLPSNDSAFFKVEDDEDGGGTKVYQIRTFVDVGEAEAWAELQRHSR